MKLSQMIKEGKLIIFLGGKCVECSSNSNLQLDHIDRKSKLFTISAMRFKSEELIKEELKKCQILCASCHAKKTHKERPTAMRLQARKGIDDSYPVPPGH